MKHPVLIGNHIRLRAIEPEDLEVMDEVENDSSLWEFGDTVVPYSRYALRQYIEGTRNDIFADKQLRLMVVRMADNVPIGIIDLYDFSPLHARGAVGITMLPRFRHAGYGGEALTLLCEYAFGLLRINQLYAYVAVDNLASLRLFASRQFVPCGLLHEWLCAGDGLYKDVAVLQRLRARHL